MATFAHASQSTPENIHEMLAVWGREIAEARIRFGLSEDDFATCLFVAPTTISRLERGDPSVSLGIFVNALWALGLNERLDAEFVSIDETFCVPGEEVDCVPEASPPSNDDNEATMSLKAPIGPTLITKTTGHMSDTTGTWAVFPQENPVQNLQTKLQELNRATVQSGADSIQKFKDGLKSSVEGGFTKFLKLATGYDLHHVDMRFFQARTVDTVTGFFNVRSEDQKQSKPETRRERRRRIICRAVAQARHLNGANANVPPPNAKPKLAKY